MFCAIAQNTFFLVYYSDERFSAGDERVESAFKLLPNTATHVHCSYQQFSSKASCKIATHRDSPSKTSGSYALVLTCEYATPTSYIWNSLLCWTKRPSSHQVDRENDKQSSPNTPSSLYYTRSVVQMWRDYTCHTYQLLCERPTRSVCMRMRRDLGAVFRP